MPVISEFKEMKIRLNWFDEGRHHMPHLHVEYKGMNAVFDYDGYMIACYIPRRQKTYVSAWILLHQEDLDKDWLGKEVFKIEPLR